MLDLGDGVVIDLRDGPEVRDRLPAEETPTPRAFTRRSRRVFLLAMVVVVALGGALRAMPLTSALPYLSYIDEGHVLDPTAHMLSHESWDPAFYRYPSLLMDATAVAAVALSVPGEDLSDGVRATDESESFDMVAPVELIVAGRLVVLAAGIGTIVVTMLLARRMLGPTAGVLAGLIVACVPALVSRSAITLVDTPAAFFTMAALLAASAAGPGRRGGVHAAAAGAMAGLAFTSKYPSGAVLVSVVVIVVLLAPPGLRPRLLRSGAVVGAAVLAAVITMPALVLRTSEVRAAIERQAEIYASKAPTPGLASQVIRPIELGWVVLAVAAVGLVVLLRRRTPRIVTIGWLAGAVPLLVFILRQNYQPVRNVIPLVPFVAIAAAAAIDAASSAVARTWSLGRTTRAAGALAATLLLVGLLLIQGVLPALQPMTGIVDSRTRAVDWLEGNVHGGQRVLVAEELVILPGDLAEIPGTVTVHHAAGPEAITDTSGYDYVVTGRWTDPPTGWPVIGVDHPRAVFGHRPVPPGPNLWRTSGMQIAVFARL